MTQITFDNALESAKLLDQQDPLSGFREKFFIPRRGDREEIYFVGNSLGLQPKRTPEYVQQELESWQERGVRGHFEGQHPWMPYHEFLTKPMANLVGGKLSEVVVMNSLTTNLHLMMASFYRPTSSRNQILIEKHAFPSDHYAVESQIKFHGFDPAESMVLVEPRLGESNLRSDDIAQVIDKHHDSLALILLPGVQYYTGQFLDIPAIVSAAAKYEIPVGIDLAHAVGNVPLELHEWQVDFACWCTYKYLNSGPGSVGGCFVHEKHLGRKDLPRFTGWWGHEKSTRFEMSNQFEPAATVEVWQLSNPPILSLAAIRASLDLFEEVGRFEKLREKSILLTGYFEWLLKEELGDLVSIITPADSAQRGCQLSLTIDSRNRKGKEVHEELEARGLMTDWREPNVIRAAPVPLYNTFEDVFHFVKSLKELL